MVTILHPLFNKSLIPFIFVPYFSGCLKFLLSHDFIIRSTSVKYGVTYNDTQISLEKSERKDH